MLNLTKVSNSCYLMTQIYGSTLSICRRNIFANFVNGCIWEKEINCKCLINYLKTLGFQNGIIHRKIFDLTIFLLLTQPFQRLCIQVCKKKKKAFDLIAGTGQMQIDINLNEPPFISISYTHTHTHREKVGNNLLSRSFKKIQQALLHFKLLFNKSRHH